MAVLTPSRARRWRTLAHTIGVCGIVASAVFSLRLAAGAEERTRDRFEGVANEIASHLDVELHRYSDIVLSARASASAGGLGNQAAFGTWMDHADVRTRFPHASAFGWVAVVPGAELDANLRHLERDWGVPPGALELDAPRGRPFYCVPQAFYILQDQGLKTLPDSCSSATMSMAEIARARDTGTLAATMYDGRGVTTDGTPIVTVIAPLYGHGEPPTTVRERRARWTGWIGVTIEADQLLEHAVEHTASTGAVLTLAGDEEVAAAGGAGGDLRTSRLLPGGERWQVEVFGSSSAIGPSQLDAWALLLVGSVLSVLATALMRLLITSRHQALALADRRTDELEHQALHDPLTGLANRTLVADRAEQLLASARRRGHGAAALYIDLDGFKEVNDTRGHHVGDELLQAVSARLQGVVREADTVGRMGGDEFVVLVEQEGLAAGADAVAERIRAVLNQPYLLDGAPEEVRISASIGVATGDRRDADELLRDADLALYEAKAEGKNCHVLFQPAMQEVHSERLQLLGDLRHALEREEFHLLFQPTLDLRTESVTGVEALLRWDHPTRGLVPPDQFIPVAEERGLIVPIGRWVLDAACQQAAQWHALGHRLQMSVNVSSRQLDSEVIIDDVRGALERTGLDPQFLVLEITETALMRDPEAASKRLHRLKALGVKIAIDDFGTGYSSLAYLQQFPVDALKIDRSFISGITQSAEADALIHTLVQLGKALDLATLAEGVESQDQVSHLLREECELGQGFLFARPLAADAVPPFLREWSAPRAEANLTQS